MKTKLQSELGLWHIRKIDGSWDSVEVKTQALAKWLNDNMRKLGIVEWESDNYRLRYPNA